MEEWIEVARTEEFKGRVLRVSCRGRPIALFKLKDGIFALEDVCSHEQTAIAGGAVWGDTIECPRHGARFDIRTGKNLSLPAVKPVTTFPVKVEEGVIFIQCSA
jgi:nitrite reductase/ring-hydroxylating ferredoxin subunit